MFVKIENYCENEALILNTDKIISVEWGSTDEDGKKSYSVYMVENNYYNINEQIYNDLCKVLEKK